MKDLLIFNAHAAKGASTRKPEEILTALESRDIHPELAVTEHPMHAAELAEQAIENGTERIFITGGDGSLNEAVNGMVQAQKAGAPRAALAVIPNGRGNDFVTGLGLPRDIQAVADMIRADHRISIDIAAAGDGTFERYYANGAGFGIESAVNYYASVSPLNGKVSYLYGVVKAVFNDLFQQKALITLDGEEFEAVMVLFTAMNGRQEGGGFRLAPDFSVTDGLLDICYLGDGLPAGRLVKLIPRLSSGKLDHPDIHYRKAKSVHVHLIDPKKGLFSQVDGETIIQNGCDFYASISPYQVDLIVPETFKA